ncbi:MAG: cytochrome c biogenesis protein [Oscillatoriales cyanobacterium SM2_2_1]|nr:cytochrome c biogenesis protein [Oscillatoriales cyanobacterium SM2_2_1]
MTKASENIPPWPSPLKSLRRFWRHEFLPLLANLQLAIALLLLIAVFSIAGTVIEQGQSLDYYRQNYPEHPALFGFLTAQVIVATGLDRVYSSWWYLALLILLAASLLACTGTRQMPMLRVARRWFYYQKPESIAKLPLHWAMTQGSGQASLESLAATLRRRRFQVFCQGTQLYARRGLVGRVGPILVHASLLLILAGGVWGAAAGFMTQGLIPAGDTFRFQQVLERGPWARVPQDWQVRVNRFWIDYSPSGSVEQFYSDLSVVDRQGAELKRETIHVNQPLRFGGVTLYQANWDLAAVKFTLNQSPVLQLPLTKLRSPQSGSQVWGTWIPTKTDLSAGVSLITPDMQGTFLIFDEGGQLLQTTRLGEPIMINGITLTLGEVVGATGLQIKSDPGVPLVYLGFGLLMVGVVMSYVSHSQVWALSVDGVLYVGGKTNRALVNFAEELGAIVQAIPVPAPGPQTVHQ